MDTPLDTPAETLPEVKTRRSPIFVVLYATPEGEVRFSEEPSRPQASKFVGSLMSQSCTILHVYKVSEKIQVKTRVTL